MNETTETESYFCGLTNEFKWQVFQAAPQDATAETTGYLAVSAGFATQQEAQDQASLLPTLTSEEAR